MGQEPVVDANHGRFGLEEEKNREARQGKKKENIWKGLPKPPGVVFKRERESHMGNVGMSRPFLGEQDRLTGPFIRKGGGVGQIKITVEEGSDEGAR